MKVGTDAVLLGSWVDVTSAENILDIGTGSGVIALMLAQRTTDSVSIESVEIEKSAADQASENFRNSPWSSRIAVHQLAAQDYFPPRRFDLIVTNPPYFNKSLQPPDKVRHAVRHTTSLSYEHLLSTVTRLLTSQGRFDVILPYKEGIEFSELALRHGLFCKRRYHFRTRKEKALERTLLEFATQAFNVDEGEILLYENDLEWSTSYRSLISEFYTKG